MLDTPRDLLELGKPEQVDRQKDRVQHGDRHQVAGDAVHDKGDVACDPDLTQTNGDLRPKRRQHEGGRHVTDELCLQSDPILGCR